MQRGTWVLRDGKLIPKHLAKPLPRGERSPISAPMIIRDNLDDMVSMHDGKIYTSKSSYRKACKEAGYIEIGNEKLNPNYKDPEVSLGEVGQAYQKVKQGYKPARHGTYKIPDHIWHDDIPFEKSTA